MVAINETPVHEYEAVSLRGWRAFRPESGGYRDGILRRQNLSTYCIGETRIPPCTARIHARSPVHFLLSPVCRRSRPARDPIGYEGGINPYGYVNSSPVGTVDAEARTDSCGVSEGRPLGGGWTSAPWDSPMGAWGAGLVTALRHAIQSTAFQSALMFFPWFPAARCR